MRSAPFRALAALALGPLALVAGAGCIRPPPIVMVDRATALEQQASGSFDDVEQRLERAAVEPRPVPLTPAQLEALGLGGGSKAEGTDVTDADRVDGLLAQHCLGEGTDGLLADTRDQCHGATDAEETLETMERVNRARRQMWKWMHEQRASASVDDLRKAWREVHLRAVVCGGWIQGDDGKWQAKAC